MVVVGDQSLWGIIEELKYRRPQKGRGGRKPSFSFARQLKGNNGKKKAP